MFAVLAAGSLVQTNGNKIDETKFVFNLENLDQVNHVVVFMTGSEPFPQGYGGSVYMSWANQNQGWQLIGHITNEKPSAVFKITGLKNRKASAAGGDLNHAFSNVTSTYNAQQLHHAQIGISIEQLNEIANQTPAETTAVMHANTFQEFTSKMCSGLFNYASSFSITPEEIVQRVQSSSNMSAAAQTQFVQLSVLEDWYNKFRAKLSRDVYFWRK